VAEVVQIITRFGNEDSESHIVKFSDHTEHEVVWALKWLMEKGWIETSKKGNSTLYSMTRKGLTEHES
jgi:DNA-binding transcriptional regulator PaaX